MSTFLNLYTELPPSELLSKVEQGLLGPVVFTPMESSPLGRRFRWTEGYFTVTTPSEAGRESVQECTKMHNPCSELYISPSGAKGYLDVLKITADALEKLQGDLLLLHSSEHVLVERIGGIVTLSRDGIAEEHRQLFPTPYELEDFPLVT